MTKIKLNVHDAVAVPVEPPKVEVQSFKQKSPAYWRIIETDIGIIANSNLGDSFVGTVEDFNKRLRN